MGFSITYTWIEVVYILLVFGAATIAAVLSAYAWHHREQPAARSFAAFMLLVAFWCLTSGIFAAASTAQTALFWNNIGISVVMYTPVAFLIFGLNYVGRGHWLTPGRHRLLLGISTALALALWTNPWHHLLFRSLSFSRHGAFMVWDIVPGPGFVVYFGYNYGLALLAMLLIVRMVLRSFRLYRQQAIAILTGVFLPVSIGVLDAFGLIPGMPELAPVGFAGMGVVFAFAMFRHQLLDMVPVARDLLIDSMDDGMLVLDTRHRIVDLNRAMEQILEISSSDVVGQTISAIGTFWNTLVTSLQQSHKIQTEIPLQRHGMTFYYDLRISPLYNRRNKFSGHLVVLRDITERKRAEQQLLKLQQAVETTEVGVTITNNQGIIEYVNPADAAMHGYVVSELLGQPSSLFAPPDYRQHQSHTFPIEGLEVFPHWVRESVNMRKDGTEFAVKLISNPIYDDQDRQIGRVTVCEDITERKHAEAALLSAHRELKEKNWQLQELNASKDKFFSIISHDLRSPFTTLLGFAQLLDAKALTYTPEELQHKAMRIRTSAERLYALLENLLTWSRLQRGLMEYRPEHIDMWELVVQNFDLFQNKSEEKQVALQNRIEPGTVVYADEQMIDTVLRNLLSNALKFTSADDTITVSGRHKDLWLHVSVQDTGVGMDAETMSRLFRDDTQQTSPGTAGEKGTGLGLLLCQELVQQNGGSMRVDSEEGQGTTFLFTVPVPS
jgi:PAS domain S-box-containing protein